MRADVYGLYGFIDRNTGGDLLYEVYLPYGGKV